MSSVEKKISAVYVLLFIIGIYVHGIWSKTFDQDKEARERAEKYQEILYRKIDKLESNIKKNLDNLNNNVYKLNNKLNNIDD